MTIYLVVKWFENEIPKAPPPRLFYLEALLFAHDTKRLHNAVIGFVSSLKVIDRVLFCICC